MPTKSMNPKILLCAKYFFFSDSSCIKSSSSERYGSARVENILSLSQNNEKKALHAFSRDEDPCKVAVVESHLLIETGQQEYIVSLPFSSIQTVSGVEYPISWALT